MWQLLLALTHLAGLVIGWVYWAMINQDKDDYNNSTVEAALAMAIIGLFFPLVGFINLFLYYFAQDDDGSNATNTMSRRKRVKFNKSNASGNASGNNVLPMRLR